jgi:hypothetical protein
LPHLQRSALWKSSILIEADTLCTRLCENRKDGEEEEILTLRVIITEWKRNLGPEMRQWKLEEGIHIASSDKR